MADLSNVAKEVIEYVNHYLKKSSTLTALQKTHSGRYEAQVYAIVDLRDELENRGLTRIDPDNQIYELETRNEVSKKYSLGNCFEFACLGLEKIMSDNLVREEKEQVSAEVYRIGMGDHGFIVIGRPKNSVSHDPLTWGNAIICDPWSKTFYPAKDYKQHLKNHNYNYELNTFQLEPLQPYHTLIPMLSSQILERRNSSSYIVNMFCFAQEKQALIYEAATKLKARLIKLETDLKETQDEKKVDTDTELMLGILIPDLVKKLDEFISQKKELHLPDEIPNTDHYHIAKKYLEETLQKELSSLINIIDIRNQYQQEMRMGMFSSKNMNAKKAFTKVINSCLRSINKLEFLDPEKYNFLRSHSGMRKPS